MSSIHRLAHPTLLLSVVLHAALLAGMDQTPQVSLASGAMAAPIAMQVSLARQESTSQQQEVSKTLKEVDVAARKKPLKPAKKKPEKAVRQAPLQAVKSTARKKTPPSTATVASTLKSGKQRHAAISRVRNPSFRNPPHPPVYPRMALRRRQQGEALVQALVNANGDTEKIELIRSSGFELLDQSALRAVAGWEFEAAKINGVFTRAWIEVPVTFQIN